MKKLITGALVAIMTASLFTAEVPAANAAVTDNTKAAAGEEITLPKSKGNPINGFDENGNILYAGDPGVFVDGDTVYLYLGHDNTANDGGYSMPDWLCYSTTDLETWKYHGVVASADKSYLTWTSGNEAWAGQVMKHRDPELDKDFYYFYYCSAGPKKIGVGIADTPLGWSDTGAKAAYCQAKGITDPHPDSKYFVDLGIPLVQNDVTWPYHMDHDDIDPTAWVETDENGVEHRYIAWGNSYCYIAELNEDMISIMDKDNNGLITMKTTRSLLTTNGISAINQQNYSRTQVVDRDYTYPSTVTYKALIDKAYVTKTIPAGSSYPDGDIICSKFRTYNTYEYEGDTPYDTEYKAAVDNDGKSMAGLLEWDDDDMLNGLFTWKKDSNGKMVPIYHFFTEAPFLYRRQDENGKPYGKYYLFFAVDYSEQLAYATCDDLNKADWEFQDVLLPWNPNCDTRHPSVFDFKGKTYLIDHNSSLPWGLGKRRVAYIEEINFDENGLILPVEDTATGLTGTTSWITDSADKNITHENFLVVKSSGVYTPGKKTAKKVGMTATTDEGDSKWEIVAGKADPANASYVSIESWNRPGFYLQASGNDVVLAQHANDSNSLASTDTSVGRTMTFKTVAGLNGAADTVSFESVSQEGKYLTSKDDNLVLTDGTDTDSCTFTVTSRNALKSLSVQKTKTIYNPNETLNTDDIKVTAVRQGGVTEEIKDFQINTQGINMNTPGKKTITVTYQEDNFIRTTDIEIAVVDSISLPKTLSLKKGGSQILTANVNPSGITVEWSSNKQNVAKVDQNGKVTAIGNGTATITAKVGSLSATCTVTVTTDVSSVKLSKTKLSMDVGKKFTLTAAPNPATASVKTVSWKSSNTKVAAVSGGKVTAKKPGTATITATIGGKKAECKVTVKGISKLNKKKVSLKRGKSITLKATTTPKNAKVTWKTSNKKVATVKKGKVTAKAKGKATITAKSGKTSIKCKVTVK